MDMGLIDRYRYIEAVPICFINRRINDLHIIVKINLLIPTKTMSIVASAPFCAPLFNSFNRISRNIINSLSIAHD